MRPTIPTQPPPTGAPGATGPPGEKVTRQATRFRPNALDISSSLGQRPFADDLTNDKISVVEHHVTHGIIGF